jgi:purine-binding chemotaxis protein CheW
VADELETIQYLTFTMADQLVVVDGARVREILELPSLANEMQLPDFMRGVLNLRGCPVPIIDLRLKLALSEPLETVSTFNIVVELAQDGDSVVLQALAEGVRNVLEMAPSQIEAAPHWLRCRFNTNDFKALSQILINAAPKATKPEGDHHGPCEKTKCLVPKHFNC